MDLVTKQREERKERILEVARRLIADLGYEGITMRELADESLVSVPTLYNLFGGKNELLFAAVESHIDGLLYLAGESASESEGLATILSLAEQMGRGTLGNAQYMRSLLSFVTASPDSGGLQDFASGKLIDVLVEALEQMQRKRQLASWADVRVVGERLAGQLTITTVDWAHHRISDQALPSALLYSTGLILLGLARGKAATEVEGMVRKHQAASAILERPPRPGPRAAHK